MFEFTLAPVFALVESNFELMDKSLEATFPYVKHHPGRYVKSPRVVWICKVFDSIRAQPGANVNSFSAHPYVTHSCMDYIWSCMSSHWLQ